MGTLVYEVLESRDYPGHWHVEAINDAGDGEIYMAVFSGREAEKRAREYADWKNSFDRGLPLRVD